MAKARRLLTNFSKGELSPLLEGRPDLAAYVEGGQTIENFYILRQGGLTRRPGTRFVAPAKFSDRDAILVPFEFSVDDAFVLEFGDHYVRFYKNGAQVLDLSSIPVEVATPYASADILFLHYTQSADVLFLFHPNYPQQKLSRISDTNWVMAPVRYFPPPSFEADTDISDGPDGTGGGPLPPPTGPTATMTAPTSGITLDLFTPVPWTVTASADVIAVIFYAGDVQVVEVTGTTPFTTTFSANSPGPHVLTAVARNAAGGSVATTPIVIYVPDPGGGGGGGGGP